MKLFFDLLIVSCRVIGQLDDGIRSGLRRPPSDAGRKWTRRRILSLMMVLYCVVMTGLTGWVAFAIWMPRRFVAIARLFSSDLHQLLSRLTPSKFVETLDEHIDIYLYAFEGFGLHVASLIFGLCGWPPFPALVQMSGRLHRLAGRVDQIWPGSLRRVARLSWNLFIVFRLADIPFGIFLGIEDAKYLYKVATNQTTNDYLTLFPNTAYTYLEVVAQLVASAGSSYLSSLMVGLSYQVTSLLVSMREELKSGQRGDGNEPQPSPRPLGTYYVLLIEFSKMAADLNRQARQLILFWFSVAFVDLIFVTYDSLDVDNEFGYYSKLRAIQCVFMFAWPAWASDRLVDAVNRLILDLMLHSAIATETEMQEDNGDKYLRRRCGKGRQRSDAVLVTGLTGLGRNSAQIFGISAHGFYLINKRLLLSLIGVTITYVLLIRQSVMPPSVAAAAGG